MNISIKKLNLAMANACISTEELSAKAKVNYATLTHIKRGKRAYPATIGKIARALGVPVEE